MRGQAPLKHDAAQTDTNRTTEHAQKIDGARTLGEQAFLQRPQRPQVE